jgi:hypothetical protein
MQQKTVPDEIFFAMCFVSTDGAVKLGRFATFESNVITEPLFPLVQFATPLTSVLVWRLFIREHKQLIQFHWFHFSSCVELRIYAMYPAFRPSKIENLFQGMCVDFCGQEKNCNY